jgi:tRNA dimethylallyltransferase
MHHPFDALAIVGPTASGKSSIAVEVAKRIGGAIVNGDPFQAYSGIPIGTGQPTAEERQNVPHYGYGALPLDCQLNPESFGAMVRNWLDSVRKDGRVPILVTGSGLYLRGIWDQLDSMPAVSEAITKKARRLCHQLGPPALHRYLGCVDPIRASQLHPNDGSRIQRALALHFATGRPPSRFLSGMAKEIPEGWRVLLIMPQRDQLRESIAKRVQTMAELGWKEETMRIREEGLEEHIRHIRPIGYEAWLDEPDPKQAQQKIVHDTCAYAKRQTTWFNNQLPRAWRFNLDSGGHKGIDKLLADFSQFCRSLQISD